MTLDDDVAAKLKELSSRTGKSFKIVVNELLRRGLNTAPTQRRERFTVKARPMRARPGINLDNIGELMEQIEGPEHK